MCKINFSKHIGKIGNILLAEVKQAIFDQITKICERLSVLETKISSMDEKICHIDQDTDEIKKDVKNISNRTFKLETATVEIQFILKHAGARICQPLEIGPGSPLKLTPYGEEIAKKTNGYDFIEDNKNLLFSFIDSKKHNTLYDVQAAARKILEENLSHPIMNEIKNFAYNEGINISIPLNVLGIILRDKYLKAHPEIK